MSNGNPRRPFLRMLLLPTIAALGYVGSMPPRAIAADRTVDNRVGSDGAIGLEEFERLHREVQPPSVEEWRSISWKTSILDAVAEARASGRPILLITTNGHLLGCG